MNEHGATYVVVSVFDGVLYAGDDEEDARDAAMEDHHEVRIETWINGWHVSTETLLPGSLADGA